jgi:methylenetetrahydrofolate dehydrogenase (NADP+) / methenyltetrahydrofolate cyclohydrolase
MTAHVLDGRATAAAMKKDLVLPETVTEEELLSELEELNDELACTCYIGQLALPAHIDTQRVLERSDPAKDADGLHPVNRARSCPGITQRRTR